MQVDFRNMLVELEARNKANNATCNKVSFLPPLTFPSHCPLPYKRCLTILQEESLLQIAKQVLQCTVKPTDNLLELGLNSILATQFVWQAAQFGITVAAENLFNFPTIEKLISGFANDAQQENEENEERLVIEREDKIPLTYAEKSLYHKGFLIIHFFNFFILFIYLFFTH
jgi:aryl carrier-like protein